LRMSFLWFYQFNWSTTTMMMHFCRNFVSGGFLITFGQFVPSWDSSYYQLMMTQNIPQRLLEFKMVAHGYRYNCYYNHCFLLSLLWVQCIWPLSVPFITSESIRIWFYCGAYTKHPSIWVLAKVPWWQSIQCKTMLISIPQLDYRFYCIGCQNLKPKQA
jgi:hypothetical protein